MTRRRAFMRGFLGTGLAALACQQVWRHGQDYVFADKFRVVEPGRIYRGAWQQDWPMRRIIRDHRIKTIVALAHSPTHPLVLKERALAEELGCRWVHLPIVEGRLEGQNVSDKLERAAALIADPVNQPVFFHCHHGINRASLVEIAYRTLYQGWDLDRAIDEIDRTIGLDTTEHGVDYRFMPTFYRSRVLPRRQAGGA